MEDDILNQGSEYEPEGSGYEFDESDIVSTEPKVEESEDSESLLSKLNWNKQKVLIAVIGGFILLIVIIVIAVIVSTNVKKKKEAEDLARAEALLQEEVEIPTFEYTADEIMGLRLAGYTGDEISEFEFQERSAQPLIDAAEAERKAKYEEEILPYFNSASEEFKKLWSDTWVGQQAIDYSYDTDNYSYYTETLNVDYEKLAPTGHQLFIKIYLKNGDACFTTVTPERYAQLDDSGNIVIKIKYTKTDDVNRIITSIEEIIP